MDVSSGYLRFIGNAPLGDGRRTTSEICINGLLIGFRYLMLAI